MSLTGLTAGKDRLPLWIISDLGDSSLPIPPINELVGILVRKFYEGLRVSLPHTQGVYCMECYGKWIHANIPKMVEDRHE